MIWGDERSTTRDDWQGMRVLEATEFPQAISSSMTFDLMTDCVREDVWLECCMRSMDGDVRIFLLLRANGRSRRMVAKRLDDTSARIRSRLLEAGFRIGMPDQLILDELLPCKYTHGTLFHGAEQDGAYYIPADLGRIMPLDWAAITEILCRHPNSMFSVNLLPTKLNRDEKLIIDENRRFFATMEDEVAKEGLAVYGNLHRDMSDDLLFVTVGVFGSEPVGQDLTATMERCGLTSLSLDEKAMKRLDDAYLTAYNLADELALRGHARPRRLAASMRRLSHVMRKEMATAFWALPKQTSLLTGVRISLRPRHRQPLPEAMRNADGVLLGETDVRSERVYLPLEWLPRHVAIVGMPGMGKTTYSIGLLNEIKKKGYPFLIVEPTKTEYRRMVDCVPDVRIYTVGRMDLSPMYINPFLPPKGITLEQFKPSLVSIFMAAFSMTSPLDVIFPEVVNECYTRYGWRDSSTRDSNGVTIFGLQEFICAFRDTVQRSHYDAESKMNLESGGVYRLQALLNANQVLFDTERSIDFSTMLERPTLIELDAIENVEQKSLIMSIILVNLMLVIRNQQVCDGVFKNAIMIDEAHLLLGQHLSTANEDSAKSRQSTVQMLQNMVVTIRAYGTGLIFADQSPRKMTAEIVSNCSFKTLFHLDNVEDRVTIAQDMGLDEEMLSDVRRLNPGEAYIGCSKLPVAIRIKTPNTGELLKLRDQIGDDEVRQHAPENVKTMRPFSACDRCGCCEKGCDTACRGEADFLARSIYAKVESNLAVENGVKTVAEERQALVQSAIESLTQDDFDSERLERCTMIQFIRRIRLRAPGDTVWLEEIYR